MGGPVGYAKGGLHDAAKAVRGAGRHGDSRLVHVNNEEFAKLKADYGEPTINPETGMPEFFIGKLLKSILPIAVSFIPGIGPIAGPALGAAMGAGMGALDGGGLKGAILGGITGGLGAGGMGSVGSIGAGLGKTAASAATNTVASTAKNALVDAGLKGALQSMTPGTPSESEAAARLTAIGGTPAAMAPTSASLVATKKPDFWNESPLGIKNKYAIPLGLGAAALYDVLRKKDDEPMPSQSEFFGSSFNGGGGGGGFRLASTGPGASSSGGAAKEYSDKYFKGFAEGGDVEGTFAVRGPGSGRSDEIPAMLSDGEYIIDAETVSLLGDGSSKAGAKRLDDFRVQIRKEKGRKLAKGKISHDAKRPDKYMAGGRI
jgi:hypothetical protein